MPKRKPVLRVVGSEAEAPQRVVTIEAKDGLRAKLQMWTYDEWDSLHLAERPADAWDYAPFGWFWIERPHGEEAWEQAREESDRYDAIIAGKPSARARRQHAVRGPA